MYPIGDGSPRVNRLPEINKKDISLRSLAYNRGTVIYGEAKELARILRPLVSKSPHQIKNIKDFVDQVQNIRLEEGEYITSYDVTALFTSVPVDPTIKIIKNKVGSSNIEHPLQ